MTSKVCAWFRFRDNGLEPRGRLTLKQKTRDFYRTRGQYVSALCVMHKGSCRVRVLIKCWLLQLKLNDFMIKHK